MGAQTHQRKRDLRLRLSNVCKQLAVQQRHPKHKQILQDLVCNLDLTGPIDTSRLPMNPDGFTVQQTAQERHRNVAFEVLCLLQVVSMAILYYWMFAALLDDQDARSCRHYLSWLEAYAKAPERYVVIRDGKLRLYLYQLQGTPEDKPHLPKWLKENGGETV